MSSVFNSIFEAPIDPILGLPLLYHADKRKEKVNLGIGSYKTEKGQSYQLKAVIEAEKLLLEKNAFKDYLPIEGDQEFCDLIKEVNLGKEFSKDFSLAVQTIGGTGALKLAGEFIKRFIGDEIYISNPSWPNHELIFKNCGLDVIKYPYYNSKSHVVDFKKMLAFFEKTPDRAVILMQNACHNPTGADLKEEEWQILAKLFKQKHFFTLFDNAYQGLGRSLEEDTYAIKLFQKEALEMMITFSCSKNFGLYGERVGALIIYSAAKMNFKAVMSQLRQIIRSIYSSPAIHGVAIVKTILQNEKLKQLWQKDLEMICQRVSFLRLQLSDLLNAKGEKDYSFLKKRYGFFVTLDFTSNQIQYLQEKKGLYMNKDRINLAGLTEQNFAYVVESILSI